MKDLIKKIIFNLLNKSLIISNKERKEVHLKNILSEIVSDLTNQYSTFKIDMKNEYLVNKVRGQHSFQMSLTLKAIDLIKKSKKSSGLNIVDIGDSSGTHLIYLNTLLKDDEINTLSVNLDSMAIEKIKEKGLNAIKCRAEELHLQENGMQADIFLSFEMLEHLFNPIDFLHTMSEKSRCEYFVITIPYILKSRVALPFVVNKIEGNFQAENTHVFEFSPNDWDKIFQFSGWEIVHRDKYTQYPNSFPFNLTKFIWRKLDFDGFYGVILKKNNKFSKRYLDW